MANIIKLDAPLESIDQSKAEQIRDVFIPMADMLAAFEDDYRSILEEMNNGITGILTAKAKRLRIDIGKVRISTEKIRKIQKEEYLRAGKAIDGVSNILKWAIVEKENKLKEIEDYYIIQEAKQKEAIQNERMAELSKYVDSPDQIDLASMNDDVWGAYIATKRQQYDDRIEAERKAEADKIAAEKAEQERIEAQRIENEKLKKEAAKREKKAEAERKKAEERRLAEQKIAEAKIKKEREAKEKLEAELRAKAEAERRAIAEEEEKRQLELNKGDVAKVKDLIHDFSELKTKYIFKSKKNKQMYLEVGRLIDKIITFI